MPRADQIVHAPDALPVWPVWSKAVKSRGMVYVAGNIGCNPDVATLVPGGIQGQTRAALENIAKVLKDAGCGMGDIVKANVYLTDMANLLPMNEVYMEFFKDGLVPARTTIAVQGLPFGALVEIECVAELPDGA